jgi:hypothetical protein
MKQGAHTASGIKGGPHARRCPHVSCEAWQDAAGTGSLRQARPWLDQIFVGVWDGFKGSNDPVSVQQLLGCAVEAALFFVANPDVTVRDVAKMRRRSDALDELLDAAS